MNSHFDRSHRSIFTEAIGVFVIFRLLIETDVTYSLECKSYTCDSYWQAGGRHI